MLCIYMAVCKHQSAKETKKRWRVIYKTHTQKHNTNLIGCCRRQKLNLKSNNRFSYSQKMSTHSLLLHLQGNNPF